MTLVRTPWELFLSAPLVSSLALPFFGFLHSLQSVQSVIADNSRADSGSGSDSEASLRQGSGCEMLPRRRLNDLLALIMRLKRSS